MKNRFWRGTTYDVIRCPYCREIHQLSGDKRNVLHKQCREEAFAFIDYCCPKCNKEFGLEIQSVLRIEYSEKQEVGDEML